MKVLIFNDKKDILIIGARAGIGKGLSEPFKK